MKISGTRIIRTFCLGSFFTLFMAATSVSAADGVPEKEEPKSQHPAESVTEPEEPQKKSQQTTATPKPSPQVVETPLQDMWEGVLEFFYGTEPDSTRTR